MNKMLINDFKNFPPKKYEISSISKVGNFFRNIHIIYEMINAIILIYNVFKIAPELVDEIIDLVILHTTWFAVIVIISAIASKLPIRVLSIKYLHCC